MPHAETLKFIKSSLKEPEGPSHQWLNFVTKSDQSFRQGGIFLVLVNACFTDPTFTGRRERMIIFKNIKVLQRRYPKLNIFGLQCGNSMKSVATCGRIIQTVIEEYITFPILVSDKSFVEMTNGPCCLLFEGSTNHLLHHKLDLELEGFVRAIGEFYSHAKDVPQNEDIDLFETSKAYSMRQQEVNMDPSASSAFSNLLLYYPGCISADEAGNRLFISDSNHHRIIVTDGDGKILDCIGSSPGFEDGGFESAKLLRPAASFYDVDEDCLYFLDSENNAVRRADMDRRVLETLFPAPASRTRNIWSWILDSLGLAREDDIESAEFNLDSLNSPWHLLKLGESDLVIFSRSFEMSWVMNMKTWEINHVTRGTKNILEKYGDIIGEKVEMFLNTCESSMAHRLCNYVSLEGVPSAGLMSSVANFHGSTIFCDAAGHRVLKCLKDSNTVLGIQFSNMKVLGLPYFLASPLESVFNRYLHRPCKEHLRHYNVLPGRCDIRVRVAIPKGVELVASLEESCIWRQARGSVAEVSGSDEVATSTQKVGVAQQWFDELDNLAFSNSGDEGGSQAEEQFEGQNSRDAHKMDFDCAANISPGTGEVIVSTVLYLKLGKPQGSEGRTSAAAKILNLQEHEQRSLEQDACIGLLSETGGDLHNLIFAKPLNLRIRLDCTDHPKATNPKEVVLTDTVLDVYVSLD